jgi:hypothetical protein
MNAQTEQYNPFLKAVAKQMIVPTNYLECMEKELEYLQEHYPGFADRILKAWEEGRFVGISPEYSLYPILTQDIKNADKIARKVCEIIGFHSQMYTPMEIFSLHAYNSWYKQNDRERQQTEYLHDRLYAWREAHK